MSREFKIALINKFHYSIVLYLTFISVNLKTNLSFRVYIPVYLPTEFCNALVFTSILNRALWNFAMFRKLGHKERKRES